MISALLALALGLGGSVLGTNRPYGHFVWANLAVSAAHVSGTNADLGKAIFGRVNVIIKDDSIYEKSHGAVFPNGRFGVIQEYKAGAGIGALANNCFVVSSLWSDKWRGIVGMRRTQSISHINRAICCWAIAKVFEKNLRMSAVNDVRIRGRNLTGWTNSKVREEQPCPTSFNGFFGGVGAPPGFVSASLCFNGSGFSVSSGVPSVKSRHYSRSKGSTPNQQPQSTEKPSSPSSTIGGVRSLPLGTKIVAGLIFIGAAIGVWIVGAQRSYQRRQGLWNDVVFALTYLLGGWILSLYALLFWSAI
jgi:hypothetical protein